MIKLEQLRYYDYHWFWGICYHQNPPLVNFETILYSLKEKPEEFERIQDNIEEIAHFNWFIRLIYKLFNINNYALHLIIINLHDKIFNTSSTGTEKKERTPGSSSLNFFSNFPYFSSLFDSSNEYNKLGSDLLETSVNKELIWRGIHDTVKAEVPIEEVRADSKLQVNSYTIKHLQTLGFDLEMGQTVTLQQILSAYKAQSRLTHPDRPGGSKEAFLTIHEAMTCLKDIICHTKSALSYSSWFENELTPYYQKNVALAAEVASQNAQINLDIMVLKYRIANLEQAQKSIADNLEALTKKASSMNIP